MARTDDMRVFGRRAVLRMTAAGGMGALLARGSSLSAGQQDWDSVVDPAAGDTLTAALGRARMAGGRPWRIKVEAGLLTEKVDIDVPNLTIEGVGGESSLRFGAVSRGTRPDGERWGTAGSATMTISARNVVLRGLTIENDYPYLAAKREGLTGTQAVALRVAPTGGGAKVENCTIRSYHDTLFVQATAGFRRTGIEGRVDFIFGGGAAWLEDCDILTRALPGVANQGYIAAPSTPASQRFGLVFHRCALKREAGVPDNSTWLGRPWREGGNLELLGQAAFLRCWMDAHIRREGWTSMGYKVTGGGKIQLMPQEARLFEFASVGPGASPASATRRILDAQAARQFRRSAILDEQRT